MYESSENLRKFIVAQDTGLLVGISDSSVNGFKKVLLDLEANFADKKIDPTQISNSIFQLKASQYGQKVLAANPDLHKVCIELEKNVRAAIVDDIHETNAYLFSEITYGELEDVGRTAKLKQSPKIWELSLASDKLACFVNDSILEKGNIDERTLCLQNWLYVTEDLLKKGDFMGFNGVLGGVCSFGVNALQATFSGLPDDDKALLKKFNDIQSQARSYKALRNEQQKAIDEQKKIIPSIPLMCSDAIYAYDSNLGDEKKMKEVMTGKILPVFSYAQKEMDAPKILSQNKIWLKKPPIDNDLTYDQAKKLKDEKTQPSNIIQSLRRENVITLFARKAVASLSNKPAVKNETTPLVELREEMPPQKMQMEIPENKIEHLSKKPEHKKIMLMSSPKPVIKLMEERRKKNQEKKSQDENLNPISIKRNNELPKNSEVKQPIPPPPVQSRSRTMALSSTYKRPKTVPEENPAVTIETQPKM